MVRLNTLKALAWATHLGITTAIVACPGIETTYTGTTGAKFAICANTKYQGTSAREIQGIASAEDCAGLCDQTGACFNAVYETPSRVCQIMDNNANLNWASDSSFTSIRLNNIFAEGTNIARCPFIETQYTPKDDKSSTFNICPHTDFRGNDASFVNGVTSTKACADLCYTIQNCTRAVFDSVKNECHIKADETKNTLIWSLNKKFDVIQLNLPAQPAKMGSWGDLIRLPVIPVAAYIVPAFPEPERMLVFSSWGVDAFSGASGMTQFADFNFKTGEISERQVTNTHHDMFCPGISTLEDGRIIIQGGSNAAAVSFYHPSNNSFTMGPMLTTPRGYQASCTLSDGRVFTIGGAYSGPREGKNGEVYDPKTNTWTALPGADVRPMLTTDNQGIWREDNHGWLVSWKNASVFQAGPSKNQNWYGTTGDGSHVASSQRGADDTMCGVWVMYEPGKIFSSGGSPDYTNSDATVNAHITTIDAVDTPATVEKVADMNYPRGFANIVVLPDGTVLVTGGQKRSLVFTDTDGVLAAEIYNPATNTWTVLAAEAVPRNYHSVSLLLPDATVFSGGGGLCYVATIGGSTAGCDKTVDHEDGQIFSPPYLFNGDGSPAIRPVISDDSTASVKVGGNITATVDSAEAQLVLIRMGTSTHSINTDQRRIPLDKVTVEGNKYNAALPDESGILLPGHYYLFAVNKAGVPSIAKTVQVVL